MTMPLLEVKNLTKRFGGLAAVNDVSFSVEEGEILSLIGPNGAGKSTLFKLISSFLHASSGKVVYRGEDITLMSPHHVARKGIVRTFQETTIFRNMTAIDNVVVAHHWPVTPMRPRTAWRSRTTSWPRTVARPRVGASRVVIMRSAVDSQ